MFWVVQKTKMEMMFQIYWDWYQIEWRSGLRNRL